MWVISRKLKSHVQTFPTFQHIENVDRCSLYSKILTDSISTFGTDPPFRAKLLFGEPFFSVSTVRIRERSDLGTALLLAGAD